MQGTEVVYQLKVLEKEKLKIIDELNMKNIHPVMSQLYALRGINSFQDINLAQALEPFSNLDNIDKAAEILYDAIDKREKICIVADYDVDGATACSVGVRGLKMFGAEIDFVVPDRFIHGYGLTPSVVDEAINKKNPALIVTVDNGIASHEGIDYAHSKGIKVLVTDHHLQGDTLPNADCIVNPNQKSCSFNSKSLAGCGVIFYVLAALRQYSIKKEKYTIQNSPNIFSLLDLVAIGTVADVVKLDKNNRILVKLGLDMIKKRNTKPGILALADVAKRNIEQLTTTDIGFAIGPRINAAGRLEDMTIGINCLLTDNIDVARNLASQLNSINENRKLIQTEMKDQVLDLPELKAIGNTKVAYDPNFHEGVIGIVASKVKDMFYRPTIVFADAHGLEGMVKGSGRSIPEVHLRDALDYVYKKDPSIIVKFGGHSMAAGLTINKDKFSDFCRLFEESVTLFTEGQDLKNIKEIDMDLPSEYLNLETAYMIRDEIWGQGFTQPLFIGEFEIVEQHLLKETHLKLKLSKGEEVFDAIWFFRDSLLEVERAKFVYSIGINEFRGETNIQLMIDGLYNS